MRRVFLFFVVMLCTFMAGAAGDKHGAIAYSGSTGKCGFSFDYNDRPSAESRAIKECGRGDCEVVVWFMNSCGALAQGDHAIGYAYAGSKAEAQQMALEKCSEDTKNCEVICWACNSR